MSHDGVSSFGEAVRQLLNVCAHTAKANHVMQKVCKGNLLGLEHNTKMAYISRSGQWGEKLYKSINAKGGLQASYQVVVGLLLASETDFTQALEALAGPHVSIIAAIKYNAHVITKSKSVRRGESTNDVLNSALRAVNCVNAIWYTMAHITDFLWDLVRFIPEDEPARTQLLNLRKRLSTAIERADEFSANARLKVAQECITTRLVIPTSKHYRGITRESVLGAGPVLRSAVVFKHKCKALKGISKHQPLRLSVFGNLVTLTVSKLSAETLAVPPYPLGSVTAQILPTLPDTVFRLQLGEKTSVTLRCKIAGHRDVWVNFFNGSGMGDHNDLVQKHEAFQEQLARPTPPRLAQRPSMAELSLFNETRKATAPAAEAWGTDDDDLTETDEVELQFKGLGDVLDRGADTPSMGKRVVEYCSLPASRTASPMVRTDNYTPTMATAAGHGASSTPAGRSATPPRMTTAAPTARAAPSPLRAQTASPRVMTPKAAGPGTSDNTDPELARALAESVATHEQHTKQMQQKEHRDLQKAISMSQWQPFDNTSSPSTSRPASSSPATGHSARGTSPCNDPWVQPAWTKLSTATADSASGRSSATTTAMTSTAPATTASTTSSSALAADVDPFLVSAPLASQEATAATDNTANNTRPVANSTHADKNMTKREERSAATTTTHRIIPVQPIRQYSDTFGASFV